MRNAARMCIFRAKALLAEADEHSLRYVCLELRLAIEYLTYDLLQAYRNEVPNDAITKWTPRQIISHVLDADPNAEHGNAIWCGIEHIYGVSPPSNEMQFLGKEHRFSMKWANKHHNALGNFLHAPTIYQIENSQAPTTDVIRTKALSILSECEKILSSPIYNINIGQFVDFECMDCKARIKKRVECITPDLTATCQNCSAAYKLEPAENGAVDAQMCQSIYQCNNCGKDNLVGTHRIKHGAIFKCEFCGNQTRLEQRFFLCDPTTT